jgi:hypothetical protein
MLHKAEHFRVRIGVNIAIVAQNFAIDPTPTRDGVIAAALTRSNGQGRAIPMQTWSFYYMSKMLT